MTQRTFHIMKQVQTVAALCAVLLAAQAVSADPSWFSAEGSSQSQAKTSGYYADALETELSCLSQMNFRSCRFIGANPAIKYFNNGPGSGFQAGDFALQTDFGCCSKEHRYGHREDIGMVGTDGKIGTCDWNVNLYWWNYNSGVGNDFEPVITPVVTADGSAVKFGTVTGTCYFSSAAEQCDHPLCERMVVSFNGGLYVSKAYGFTKGPDTLGQGFFSPVFASSQDTCANPFSNAATLLPDWPLDTPFRRQAGPATGAGNSAKSQPQPASGTPSAKQGATAEGNKLPQQSFIDIVLSGLMDQGINYLGGRSCFGKNCDLPPSNKTAQPGATGTAPVKASQSAGAHDKVKASIANADYAHAPEEKTYAGYAMVVSGPFSVVSSNDNLIKQTGIMEFAPTFVATPTFNPVTNAVDYPVVRPTAKWPIIRGQTAKLRFTKEREEQHYKDAYQGEGKESYQAHEPERKDAYYGNDGGNKDYGREYYGEAQRA